MNRPEMPHTAPDAGEIEAILRGQHGDPFRVLGPHRPGGGAITLSVFAPDAREIEVLDRKGKPLGPMEMIHPEGFFHASFAEKKKPFAYTLRCRRDGHEWDRIDPYAFGPVLGEMDEYLLAEGRHEELYRRLGAHPVTHEGVEGVTFAVWAPNARRVSVVGNFNAWDGRRHPMRRRGASGVWELFVPGLAAGEIYKYEVLNAYGHVQPLKSDPVGFAAELPPATASVVAGLPSFAWTDDGWMAERADARSAPVSIYEVHLGSWRRGDDGEMLDYDTLAGALIDYVTEMGFTHV
ncbi:MAG: GlgB N-terminal domain-containing protein, partial [Pseudooceanicola nanhaiensis]